MLIDLGQLLSSDCPIYAHSNPIATGLIALTLIRFQHGHTIIILWPYCSVIIGGVITHVRQTTTSLCAYHPYRSSPASSPLPMASKPHHLVVGGP